MDLVLFFISTETLPDIPPTPPRDARILTVNTDRNIVNDSSHIRSEPKWKRSIEEILNPL